MLSRLVEPPECRLCTGEHRTELCEEYQEYLDRLDTAQEDTLQAQRKELTL